MNKFLAVTLMMSLVAFSSCKKQPKSEGLEEAGFSSLVAPAGFTWAMSRDVQFNVNVTDSRFPGLSMVIAIYAGNPETGGTLLSRGTATTSNSYKNKVYVADVISEVYVVKTAPDNSTVTVKVPITSALVTVNMGESVGAIASIGKNTTIAGVSGSGEGVTVSAEPTWPNNCTTSITSSANNVSVNTNNVLCITGSNITVSFAGFNGGTVRVSGQNVTLNNVTMNSSSCTLIVTSTGSVNLGSSFQANNGPTISNYGTINIGTYSSGGPFLNEGTINLSGNLNVTGSTFTNSGNVNITGNLICGSSSTVVNTGKIIADGNLEVSGNFTNSCYLWAKGFYNQQGSTAFVNKDGGLVRVGTITTINNGGMTMSNGSMLQTNELKLDNVTVTGTASTTPSLYKVAQTVYVQNNPKFSGTIRVCSPNSAINASYFINGASQSCTTNIPITTCNPLGNVTIVDSDGDTVADTQDPEPNNPDIAISSPGKSGTLAFEDKWPIKGDYDMNDVVISYAYTLLANKDNIVKKVTAEYTLRATGGEFTNGFGIEFPFLRTAVSSLTGSYTLETGQTNAVVILFNNMREEMPTSWNTRTGETAAAAKTYTFSFNVTNTLPMNQFPQNEYNPFIFNGRTQEVHLPGHTPTAKANTTLFLTGDDYSSVASSRYYVTNTGLPWAIDIPSTTFAYPKEGKDIVLTYPRLDDWVTSTTNPKAYLDWYSNTAAGYRVQANIY